MSWDEGDRTPDLGIANAALSQLSYSPIRAYAARQAAGTMGTAPERVKRGPETRSPIACRHPALLVPSRAGWETGAV